MTKLEQRIDDLISEYGVRDVLSALCRACNDRGMATLFRKLDRVYAWLTEHDPAKPPATSRRRR